MKANEMMTMDWVMPLQKRFRGIPGQVVTIDGGTDICWIDCDDYSCLIPCCDVEGISITPEILEKNGVVKPKLSLWWLLDSPFRELWLSQHTDGSWWLYSSGDCDKDENFAEIHFVHELQHALKMCGIDKEIVL